LTERTPFGSTPRWSVPPGEHFGVRRLALANSSTVVGIIANMPRARSRDLFPSEEPIRPPGKLIGRKTDLEELTSELADGLHRIVAAPRRTGKSTVCEATVAALRRRRFYVVSVSLFRDTNAAALAETLAQETLANRSALKQLVERARSTVCG